MDDLLLKVPAACPRCALFFYSGLTLSLNSITYECATDCPRCGKETDIPSGTVQLLNGVIALVQRPDFGQDVLSKLQQVTEKARKQEISLLKAAKEVEKTHPASANQYREWINLGINAVSCFVGIAGLLFMSQQNRANQPPMEVAVNELNRYVVEEPINQTAPKGMLPLKAHPSQPLSFGGITPTHKLPNIGSTPLQHSAAQDGPNLGRQGENRRERRVRLAKERKKR